MGGECHKLHCRIRRGGYARGVMDVSTCPPLAVDGEKRKGETRIDGTLQEAFTVGGPGQDSGTGGLYSTCLHVRPSKAMSRGARGWSRLERGLDGVCVCLYLHFPLGVVSSAT